MRLSRPLCLTALCGALLLSLACGGVEVPEFYGVYVRQGRRLARLEARNLNDLVSTTQQGQVTPMSVQERAQVLNAPQVVDRNAVLYVFLDNVSALDLGYRRWEIGNANPIPVYPLVAPVEDHEHLSRVVFPEDSPRGNYEILLPGNRVCAFLLVGSK